MSKSVIKQADGRMFYSDGSSDSIEDYKKNLKGGSRPKKEPAPDLDTETETESKKKKKFFE